jgi:hypothetical protein
MTPSGIRGIVNDAVAVHLADVVIASAFVARWCRVQRAEIVDGLRKRHGSRLDMRRRGVLLGSSSPQSQPPGPGLTLLYHGAQP